MELRPGTRVGHYDVLAPLGAGGMGEVYRASDTRLGRDVALKVLPPDVARDANRRARFEREARIVAALSHPNILSLYELGTEGDDPYVVMELLEGESLAERLRQGAVPVRKAVEIAAAIARGLSAAHEKGIAHRDLKPANVFLLADGQVKILDFGLARPAATFGGETGTDLALTDPGSVLGTVGYMAPEQIRGQAVDGRADLFSLGVVLYEMLAGRRAFQRESAVETLNAILKEEPPEFVTAQSDIPPALARIVRHCLEKIPSQRFQSAKDVVFSLEALSGDHTSAASLLPRGGFGSSRRGGAWLPVTWRAGLVGALVVGLALAVGLSRQNRGQTPAGTLPTSVTDHQLVELTTTGNAYAPAVAPDGRYVVYIQRNGDEHSLWVRQSATASEVRIVPALPGVSLWAATVAPSGNYVDYVRRAEANFELWRVPLLGGPARRLIDGVHSPVGWSPDGRQFAFVRADTNRLVTALTIVDEDGEHERVLVERGLQNAFFSLMNAVRPVIAPAWASSGRHIALAAAGGGDAAGEAHIALVDVNASTARTIPLSDSTVRGLGWLDDDSLVLAGRMAPGTPIQLLRLFASDGHTERLSNDLTDYLGVSLTMDRTTLVTARSEMRGGVWVGDESGGGAVGVAPSARLRVSPTVAWAGQRLLYTQSTDGKSSIWTAGDGTPQEVLRDAGSPAMMPDDRTLVFMRGQEAERQLWKSGGDGRKPVLLWQGGADYLCCPAATPDGESVMFVSSNRLWSVRLAGGSAEPVSDVFVAAPGVDISRDGRAIVFRSTDEQGKAVVRTCQLPGCTRAHNVAGSGNMSPVRSGFSGRVRWTPDGRSIAYVDQATGGNVWVQPLDGTPARPLTAFIDHVIEGFAWSADGERLALVRTTRTSDVVLIKGLR